jgi:hypothetical protein
LRPWPDPPASRKLFIEMLGLPLEGHGGDYYHSEQIAGGKSFGIWPLSQAAEACFGTAQWPAERPVPQVSIEFDVADTTAVGPAAQELEQAGYELLHAPPPGAVGSDGREAAVARGCDRRDLIHAGAARRGLTQAATRSLTRRASRTLWLESRKRGNRAREGPSASRRAGKDRAEAELRRLVWLPLSRRSGSEFAASASQSHRP